MLTQTAIQQAAERLVAVAHDSIKVIRFGSYARQDADLELNIQTKESKLHWLLYA